MQKSWSNIIRWILGCTMTMALAKLGRYTFEVRDALNLNEFSEEKTPNGLWPPPALVSENYVALFWEIIAYSQKFIQIWWRPLGKFTFEVREIHKYSNQGVSCRNVHFREKYSPLIENSMFQMLRNCHWIDNWISELWWIQAYSLFEAPP